MKRGVLMFLGAAMLVCGGCQQNKPDGEKRSGEAKPSADANGKEDDSSDSHRSGLEAWYQSENIEQKVDFKSTNENFENMVAYPGVLDQSLLSGSRGVMDFSLKTPELSEEDVRKLGEYYFRHYTTDFKSNVVQWEVSAKSGGKEKYRYIFRYGDRYRTKVVYYLSEKEMDKGKYALSDIVEGERKEGEKLRYCFEEIRSELETHEHPQLKRKVKGDMSVCEMDILDDGDVGEIADAMTEGAQNYVEESVREEEERKKTFLGMRLTVRQFGREIAKDVIYVWDKDKRDIRPYIEEGRAKFLSKEELEKKIALP